MQLSNIPAKFPIIWGASAGGAYINPIPAVTQIGVNPGYASLPDGFVPLNATPTGAGGIPPRVQDINGILNEITAWNQWAQAGGPITYDATFQAAVGGYPIGAVVQSATTAGHYWRATTDNNVTNPDAAGAGWVDFFAPVYVSPTFTGTVTTAALTVGGAATLNGTSTFNNTMIGGGGVAMNWAGAAAFAGGVTVSAGGLNVAGGFSLSTGFASFAAGAGVSGGLTVATGALSVTVGNFSVLAGTTTFPNGTIINTSGQYSSPTTLSLGNFSGGIDNVSQLLSVNNTNGTAAAFQNRVSAGAASAMFVRCDRTDGYFEQFLFGTNLIGFINTTNGSTVNFTSLSDYRLKFNEEPIDGASGRLMKLNPLRFNWKSDPDAAKVDGFFAHEVAEVVPEAVTGSKDQVEDHGELFLPAGTILAVDVDQGAALPDDAEWVQTGERAGPQVLAKVGEAEGAPVLRKGKLIAGPPVDVMGLAEGPCIPIGTVRLKVDRITNPDTQKPDELPEGMQWRFTERRAVLQGLDPAKLMPLVVAALQEALARIAVLEATQGPASGV